MTDCIFCKIISNNIPSSKIHEDQICIAILDIQPVNTGHVLIIPKEHHKLVIDYSKEIVSHIFIIAQKINQALRRTEIKCEAVNYFLADGEIAGQEVFHTHLHVIPRYQDDGFGLRLSKRYFSEKPDRNELNNTADLIKRNLD
ncbi:hypothetical protein LCGC14_0404570 [marine sediment metagenome]|uniref:HIT domain-containing protein n=1 Tax=marine sediment metagenome TaxID=412755 RepID=A0A0F9TDK6_9ZZZZ|nr:MAG: HIT-like protein [Candidatus Lokiarchaeum sp. GC14_75]